jgi:hypothetical protein
MNTTLRPNKDRRNPTKSNLTTGVQRAWFAAGSPRPRCALAGSGEWGRARLRHLPIEQRKAKLARLVRGPHPGIVLNEHYDGDGEIVFEHACKLGCEGIVSKRLGSLYRSGGSPHWVKVKNPKAPGSSERPRKVGENKVLASEKPLRASPQGQHTMRTLMAMQSASEQFYTYAGERGGEYPHESGDSAQSARRDDAMLIDWASSSVALYCVPSPYAGGLGPASAENPHRMVPGPHLEVTFSLAT